LGLTATEGEAFSQSVTTETIYAHQRNTPLRNHVTDSNRSMNLTLTEDRKAVRELFHGAEESANGLMDITGEEVTEANFVYDSTDDGKGYEKDTRLVFRASVTPNGDITFARGTLIAYPILLTAIGKVRRLSTPDSGTVTPPVDPEDPPVTTYPEITGLVSNYNPETQLLTANWNAPTLTGGAWIESYNVSLAPMGAGSGYGDSPTGNSAELGPVASGEYQLSVGYYVNGDAVPHGFASIAVTIP
jgi:hypothetical protein